MATHTIRLNGFWKATALPTGMRFTRTFGKPRTLDANETVWIVVGSLPTIGSVRVNDTILGNFDATTPFAFEITHLLSSRNQIGFDLATTAEVAIEGVVLEIRRSDV